VTLKIQNLWEKHHEVVRLIVLGYSSAEIAQLTGYSETYVKELRLSPLIKERIALLSAERDAKTADIARDVRLYAPKAFDYMRRVQEGTEEGVASDHRLRVQAAKFLIECAGLGPVKRSVVDTTQTHKIDSDTIREIKARAASRQNVFQEAPEEAVVVEVPAGAIGDLRSANDPEDRA
jgi:transposase-like protein